MRSLSKHQNILQEGSYQQQQRHYVQADQENNTSSEYQSNSQEDYELIPRQCPIYSIPLKDVPLELRSKPFVYKRMGDFHTKDNKSNRQMEQPIITMLNEEKSNDSNPFLQKSRKQSQKSRKFIGSKSKFEQIGIKQTKSQNDIQSNVKRQKGKEDIESANQDGGQKSISSRPVVSINSLSSEEHQIEEVVAKYHFQTQKHFSQQVIKVNEGMNSSPNLIKLSPDLSLQLHDEGNVLPFPKKLQQQNFNTIKSPEDLSYTFSPKIFQKDSLLNKKQERRLYEGRGDNMVLDLGRGSANEGKIIAIYPSNKVSDVKDLMFGKNEISTPSNAQKQSENTLKIMLQMQNTFISTLKTFQTSVDHSLNLKLQEIRKEYQKNIKSRKPSQETEEKIQQISQQTNDKQEQYDDSRGSINVLYLRKLRELEEEIKQKQWKIERLEKENYYLERQLEKVQEVGFAKKAREGRSQLLSPLKNNEIYCESLSFSNKRKACGGKHPQSTQFKEMKQKLSQFQVLIKEKDLRITELEDTIMDHLQSSRRWKKEIEQQNQNGRFFQVGEYSKSENIETLQMKISNLKTLLKQSQIEAQNYKKLYETEKETKQESAHSNQKVKLENTKITYDDGKQTVFSSLINQNGTMSIVIDVLVNFIMMAWSLKEVITKLCGNEVNVDKINRNARQFLSQLKEKDVNVWRKVWIKLDEGQFDAQIREIWNE